MGLSTLTNGSRWKGLLAACGCVLLALACSAHADLEVNGRVDKVVLTDGTVIECVVLMVADNGALIVEGDPKDKAARKQRLIPKADIAKIVRGEVTGTISGYQTDTELCHKVIQGTGFRKEEPKKAINKDNVKAPTTAYDPETLAKLKLNKELAEPVPASKLTPQELRDAYLSRFPALKETAQSLLGNDRAMQVLDQAVKGDSLVRHQVEGFLNLVVSANAAPAAVEPVTPNKALKPIKPKKPRKDEVDASAPAK